MYFHNNYVCSVYQHFMHWDTYSYSVPLLIKMHFNEIQLNNTVSPAITYAT